MAENNTTATVEPTSIPMTRFSISEEDEEHSTVFKRARLSVSTSQSRRSCVADQVPVEDLESDSEASEESEDNDHDDDTASDAEEEEVEVRENSESDDDSADNGQAESVSEGQNQTAPSILRIRTNVVVAHPTASASFPVANIANGEVQVVLTDLDVLDCPICLEALCNPVFQCENGHIACSSCCSKVNRKCPSCCMPIGYNRCRAIEKVIESIKILCKNAQHGCKETITYSKKLDHEQTCPHIPCSCPHPSCTFVGSSKNMYLHFGIQHAASATRFTYNTTFALPLTRYPKRFFLQEQHESVIFVLHQEACTRGRSLGLECVGPNSLKNAFEYQISAKNTESTLSLQGVPRMYPIWGEHALTKNYLTVPSDFFGHTGTLSVQICIKKAL